MKDNEKSIQERNAKYLIRKGISNIELKNEFKVNELVSDNETDLLITEMLEHVPKNTAIEFLTGIKDKSFRKLLITLPNKDFNQFYKLGEEFRHDDHCWEPSFEESVIMMNDIFGKDVKLIKQIGDKINETSVSTLFVIEKN